MNKFEKLIEYIINDDDQKARELFHTIVVEKSRDIYESMMASEEMQDEGMVHGGQVEDLANEVSAEESMHEEEEEFSLDTVDDDSDEVSGEFPSDGDEAPAEEHEEIEDKVMNIDAKLDELLAKFDEIMGGGDDMNGPQEEPAMNMDGGMDSEEQPEQEPAMFEAKDDEDEEDDEEDKKEAKKEKTEESRRVAKTATELMREYTEKISDINLTPSTYSEGEPVGSTGKKAGVNSKSITGPGADFGGSTASSKGGVQNQDGTSAPSSDKPKVDNAGNVNVPGGKAAKLNASGSASQSAEGKEVAQGGSVPVNDKAVQKQNTGK